MDQHIRLLKVGLYVAVSRLQMRIYVLILHIFQIDPLMMLNSLFAENFLDPWALERPAIDDWKDAIDSSKFLDIFLPEGGNSTQVQISMLLHGVIFGVNAVDVAAFAGSTERVHKHR